MRCDARVRRAIHRQLSGRSRTPSSATTRQAVRVRAASRSRGCRGTVMGTQGPQPRDGDQRQHDVDDQSRPAALAGHDYAGAGRAPPMHDRDVLAHAVAPEPVRGHLSPPIRGHRHTDRVRRVDAVDDGVVAEHGAPPPASARS
jgi:hypothetical protein